MSNSNRQAKTTTERPAISIVDTQPTASAGLINLAPLQNSLSRDTLTVEIGLVGSDRKLRFGDLRAAAVELERRCLFEAAHRLWSIVGTAAFKLGDLVVATGSDTRAEHCLEQAFAEASKPVGRAAKYDYDAIVRDLDSGLSPADTAKRWGCVIATVKRASEYVAVRDALFSDQPGLANEIESGADVSDLAQRHDVKPKIMRWIVISHFDRRSERRDEA